MMKAQNGRRILYRGQFWRYSLNSFLLPKDVEGMFAFFSFDELIFNSFDTSSVQQMKGMFQGCHCFGNVDLSSFNIKSVKSMKAMFCAFSSDDSEEFLENNLCFDDPFDEFPDEFLRFSFFRRLDLSSLEIPFETADLSNIFRKSFIWTLILPSLFILHPVFLTFFYSSDIAEHSVPVSDRSYRAFGMVNYPHRYLRDGKA